MKDRLTLDRLAAMAAVATLALTQPLFTLILENPEEFPEGGLFHVWVVAWALLLPLFALMVADACLERTRLFHGWRAVLCALTAVSLLRQAFVYYWRSLDQWGVGNLFLVGAIPAAALVFFLALRHPAVTRRYLAALGVLAVLLAGKYAVGTGLWGPAWAPGEAEPVAAPATASPTPVFLVVFDELAMDVLLKEDRFDAERFPHFSAFAAENAWFSHATSNHMTTAKSVPCMLTGRRSPGPSTPTLFRYLQGNYVPTFVGGWPPLVRWMRRGAGDAVKVKTRGTLEETGRDPLVTARILASCAVNGVLARRIARDGEDFTGLLVGPAGASAFGQVDLIARTLAGSPGPGLFMYWHCPLPHSPFLYSAEGKYHGRPDSSFSTEADHLKVLDNYRDQVGLVDAFFGRFVATLREAKIYDSAIIVVTSDHGLRTGRSKLQPAGFPAEMNGLAPRVPLLLKAPGVRAGRHDEDYQHIDLAPTFLDLLGVRFDPGAFEGVSLLAAERPDRPKISSAGGTDFVFDAASGLWRSLAK